MKEGQDEDNQGFDEIERNEEPIERPLNFYWSLENWLHFTPEINCFGRVTAEEIEYLDPELEDEAKDKIRAEIKKVGLPKARLVSIVKDKSRLISRKSGKMLD